MSAKFCCLIVRLFTLFIYLSQDFDLLFSENSLILTFGTYISLLYRSSKRSKTKSLNLRAKSLYFTN